MFYKQKNETHRQLMIETKSFIKLFYKFLKNQSGVPKFFLNNSVNFEFSKLRWVDLTKLLIFKFFKLLKSFSIKSVLRSNPIEPFDLNDWHRKCMICQKEIQKVNWQQIKKIRWEELTVFSNSF